MNTLWWVWLQAALGPGSVKAVEAARFFGSPKALYEAGEREWRLYGRFTQREIHALQNTSLTEAQRILTRCGQLGYQVFTPDDAGYPQRLKEIYAPPAAFYVLGRLPEVDGEVLVALVGTREATSYGQAAATRLSMRLAAAGVVVVSGGAMGIDSFAHNGAMQAGGRTVAVLGCGIDYPYLMGGASMREAITRHGALVSEYPPGTPPTRYTFPARNRLISGLSLGTVIVEAGEKSGSLITAARAVEQGRDVFAIPGSVMSPRYAGTNRLLHDGAKPVYCALDVLEEYAPLFPNKLKLEGAELPIGADAPEDCKKKQSGEDSASVVVAHKNIPQAERIPLVTSTELPGDVPPQCKALLCAFQNREMTLDALALSAGCTSAEALRIVTQLEILGYVQPIGGGRYRLTIKNEEERLMDQCPSW